MINIYENKTNNERFVELFTEMTTIRHLNIQCVELLLKVNKASTFK